MNLRQKVLLLLVVGNLAFSLSLWKRQSEVQLTRSEIQTAKALHNRAVAATGPEMNRLVTRVASLEDRLRMDWSTLGPGRDDPRGWRKYP